MRYAVVMGEALVDLLETTVADDLVYRQAIGGAPLNVAVGVARLGGAAEFAGSLGDDVLADRIGALLSDAGVGTRGVRRAGVPTTLAVATFDGSEPDFRFYGEPPSYALLTPDDIEPDLVAGAAVLYTGSISLLREPFLSAARAAWKIPGPLRVFDPNVRPNLLPDAGAVDSLRRLVAEFAATADLVKLSAADAAELYEGAEPDEAARRLRALGARNVVVTRGSAGALLATADGTDGVPAPRVEAVDATGAGDSVMAALIRRLLAEGLPTDLDGWRRNLRFALAVAGLVCERRGGAVAMPTPEELARRWGPLD